MTTTYNYNFDDHMVLVKENNKTYKIDLGERLLQFAVDIINFLFLLPYIKEMEVFRFQLSKAGTSIGANYSPGKIA